MLSRSLTILTVVAAVVAASILSCFSPNLGPAPFACAADGACPSGYACFQGVCLLPGEATVGAPDLATSGNDIVILPGVDAGNDIAVVGDAPALPDFVPEERPPPAPDAPAPQDMPAPPPDTGPGPCALAGEVVINELLFDPAGTDTAGLTFIELRGSPGLALTGAKLVARNRSSGAVSGMLALSGAIGPSGFFVVGQDPSDPTFSPDITTGFADLTNTGAGLELQSCDGSVVDAVAYGAVTAPGVGEGTPATGPPSNSGDSLARCQGPLSVVDTDDNSRDFHDSASPTPGADNGGFVDPQACP
jgi:hypothetical protein